MKRIAYSLGFCLLVLIQAGCSQGFSIEKPYPLLLRDVPPPGRPPEYQKAFKEGCESAIALYGYSIYRNMYDFKYDPQKMVNDNSYYRAWKDGQQHCIYWVGSGKAF